MVFFQNLWARIGAIFVIGIILASCGIVLDQPNDRILIRTATETVKTKEGEIDVLPPAQAYAENYLDYALLSEQTYVEDVYARFLDRNRRHETPYQVVTDRYCYEAATGAKGCTGGAALAAYAAQRLDRWRLIFASEPGRSKTCLRSRFSCSQQFATAGVQIWVSKGKACKEAVVAFRGTQGDNLGEWHTNFRWITRFYPTYDLYKQVQENVPGYMNTIKQDDCYRPGATKLLAVGHSLGGGLAQQAAFRGGKQNEHAGPDGRFDKVVVFDPSPVTGYFDINAHDRQVNSQALKIERVYEDGESLAYVRFILRQLVLPSACNPQVVNVRFNVIQGRPSDQHQLAPLTSALLAWSQRQRTSPLPDKSTPPPEYTSCDNGKVGAL